MCKESKKKEGKMKSQKILGIALIIVGACMLFFSDYIAEQVSEGRMQIRSAQSQVDTADSLFSQSQYTKPIGKIFTGSAQKKIDAGRREADKYSELSQNLKIGGIILIIVGAAVLIFAKKKKR
jgi:hypothetical protein